MCCTHALPRAGLSARAAKRAESLQSPCTLPLTTRVRGRPLAGAAHAQGPDLSLQERRAVMTKQMEHEAAVQLYSDGDTPFDAHGGWKESALCLGA